jgi:hypothetical protein
MAFMLKKVFLCCLICTSLYSLTACKNSQEEMEDKENYDYVLAFFVPEDAEIITCVDDFLVLNSTLPLSELIVFYENAFHRLMDVHETEIDGSQDGVWIFSGVYHGIHIQQTAFGFDGSDNRERPFIVELRDNGESVDIERVY